MRCRTVLWYLVFAGSALNMIIMTNMNIALVGMVVHKTSNNATDIVGSCNNSVNNTLKSESDESDKVHQVDFFTV